MSLQVLSQSSQARILDGGYGPDGERRQVRIDPKAFGTLPEWAASLPVLHRAVNRGEMKIVSGSLADPVAPNTEPPSKPVANTDALATQLLSMLASLPAEQRAKIAQALTAIG